MYCNVLHPQNWINESHVKSQKNDQNRLRARGAHRASSHSLLRSSEFKLRTRSSWIVPRLPTSWNIWNHIPKASESIRKLYLDDTRILQLEFVHNILLEISGKSKQNWVHQWLLHSLWDVGPRLNVSQALNGCSRILRVHLVPVVPGTVLDGDSVGTVSVGAFSLETYGNCIPKGSSHIGRTGHISKCLGNGSTYVLSSSPYRRDVQGKTNGVNQKTHKMSHVLYHLPNFTMGGAQKTQEPLHV